MHRIISRVDIIVLCHFIMMSVAHTIVLCINMIVSCADIIVSCDFIIMLGIHDNKLCKRTIILQTNFVLSWKKLHYVLGKSHYVGTGTTIFWGNGIMFSIFIVISLEIIIVWCHFTVSLCVYKCCYAKSSLYPGQTLLCPGLSSLCPKQTTCHHYAMGSRHYVNGKHHLLLPVELYGGIFLPRDS